MFQLIIITVTFAIQVNVRLTLNGIQSQTSHSSSSLNCISANQTNRPIQGVAPCIPSPCMQGKKKPGLGQKAIATRSDSEYTCEIELLHVVNSLHESLHSNPRPVEWVEFLEFLQPVVWWRLSHPNEAVFRARRVLSRKKLPTSTVQQPELLHLSQSHSASYKHLY